MSKRLRKISKLNLNPIIITDENKSNDLKELKKHLEIDTELELQELEKYLETDSNDLEKLILEDSDPLEVNHEYYKKPKSRPLPTNKNWYI